MRFEKFQTARLKALGMPGHRVLNLPDQLNNLSPDEIRMLAREYTERIVQLLTAA